MRRQRLGIIVLVTMIAALLIPMVALASSDYQKPSFHHQNFQHTWEKDDQSVIDGKEAKSWTWGPALKVAYDFKSEPYKEAPKGFRTVQYFDKSRMEDNSYRSKGDWAVTNGLLVVELVTGRMQIGDDAFIECRPSDMPVAGDMDQGHDALTYAKFYNDIKPGGYDWAPEFQKFMSKDNATYKVGLASSPAWWTDAKVNGTIKKVLVQLGERRALTYTPDNPHGWQVEWGNVGAHYFEWRYGKDGCAGKLEDPGHGPDPTPPVHKPKPEPPVHEPKPEPPVKSAPEPCYFPEPGKLDKMDSKVIEEFKQNTWTHRVFNEHLFKAPDWGGADSWFVTLALGNHSGGNWTDHGNPGQIVYRGTDTHIRWCLGVLTTSKYIDQFLAGASGPVAINVRIAPNSMVTVVTNSGNVVSQATSDMGDITIILPNDGVVSIAVDYTTAAPTHESLVWWGPYDRSEHINTIDAR